MGCDPRLRELERCPNGTMISVSFHLIPRLRRTNLLSLPLLSFTCTTNLLRDSNDIEASDRGFRAELPPDSPSSVGFGFSPAINCVMQAGVTYASTILSTMN